MATNKTHDFRKKAIVISAIVVGLGALFIAGVDNSMTTTTYKIETEKLKEPIRVALLTDLHSEIYGENQADLIAEINRHNPDIICMVGDIADDRAPHDGTILLLEGIASRYPCFYVTGNHEFWSGEVNEIKDFFRRCGVRVFEGEHETIEISGQTINICGVDDPEIGESNYMQQLEDAFTSIDSSNYTILLSHRPERFVQQAEYDYDVILSGHAHGGQVRIPFIGGLYSPDQGIFPNYTSGMYTLEDTQMLVSRGLSREVYMVPRLFNAPELIILEISS